MNDAAVRASLTALLHTEILSTAPEPIAGGSINRCFRYRTREGSVFVKVASVERRGMFDAEVAGLKELIAAQALRVPNVLGVADRGEQCVLALEWLELHRSTPATDAALGEQLALQHRVVKPLFGFKQSNFIGTTPQPNLWSRDWLNFWRTHRIDPQLDLAITNGAHEHFVERAALLNTLMDGFFASYSPQASLLHGDLWSGNVAADASGWPVTFDPAVYFGDRECDIAMTKLFGGFSENFYAAYENAWPLEAGSRQRIDLYNLYHVLNHFNLFDGGYLAQAEGMIERLLSELGH